MLLMMDLSVPLGSLASWIKLLHDERILKCHDLQPEVTKISLVPSAARKFCVGTYEAWKRLSLIELQP